MHCFFVAFLKTRVTPKWLAPVNGNLLTKTCGPYNGLILTRTQITMLHKWIGGVGDLRCGQAMVIKGSVPSEDPHVDKMNTQASMLAAHSAHVTRLLGTLEAEASARGLTAFLWVSSFGA